MTYTVNEKSIPKNGHVWLRCSTVYRKWRIEKKFLPTKHDSYLVVSRKDDTQVHEDGVTPIIDMELIDVHNDDRFVYSTPKIDRLALKCNCGMEVEHIDAVHIDDLADKIALQKQKAAWRTPGSFKMVPHEKVSGK